MGYIADLLFAFEIKCQATASELVQYLSDKS